MWWVGGLLDCGGGLGSSSGGWRHFICSCGLVWFGLVDVCVFVSTMVVSLEGCRLGNCFLDGAEELCTVHAE